MDVPAYQSGAVQISSIKQIFIVFEMNHQY